MPRIVYFFEAVFYPTRKGCHVVAQAHVEYLARGTHDFCIVVPVHESEEPFVSRFLRRYGDLDVRLIHMADEDPVHYSQYSRLFEEHSFESRFEASRVAGLFSRVREEISQADIFFGNYVFSAPLLEHLPNHSVSVVQAHNLEANKIVSALHADPPQNEIEKRAQESLHRRLMRKEVENLRLFDYVISIAPDEAALISDAIGRGKVFHVPPAIFMQSPSTGKCGESYDILYVGGTHKLNLEGLREFYYRSYVPYLKPRGVRLTIAGVAGELWGISDPSVRCLGRVDDLADVYARSMVVVCPVRYGAGCNIKLVEAMTYGKPVVATPQAVRGLNEDGTGLLIADDPKLFSDYVLNLLGDEAVRAEHARRSREIIAGGHSEGIFLKAMDEVFRTVADEACRRQEMMHPGSWIAPDH